MRAHIKIFSAIGNTPITKREGNFFDVLIMDVIDVDSTAEAEQEVKILIRTIKDAATGFYYVPDEPNQNIRSKWL